MLKASCPPSASGEGPPRVKRRSETAGLDKVSPGWEKDAPRGVSAWSMRGRPPL